MVSFPPCKINLGLNIIAKRSDGYHDIETCFYPLPWTDILEIIPAKEMSFSSSGISIPGKEEDNLCLKAYYLLKKDFDLQPVSIHLHKIIPTGAGLGGGSSDAAHSLKLLNTIFNLQLSIDTLKNYASRLGSDCGFFIESKPMLGEGRGELLSSIAIDLRGYYLVLAKPDVHVSTAEAYAGVAPQLSFYNIKSVLEYTPMVEWKRILKNDFEESVFQKYPQVGEIKNTMYSQGAIYASMSGSGSSVFGLFNYQLDLKNEFKGLTYWAGGL